LKHELTRIDRSSAATIGSDFKTIQGERLSSVSGPRNSVANAIRLVGRVGLVALLVSAKLSVATPVTVSYLEGKNPVAPDAVATYGPDLMGDKVNLFSGTLEFEHTDLSLPGNNALPVALVRKHTAGRPHEVQGQFGDWDLETPRIGGTFSNPGWVTANYGVDRCTSYSAPPGFTGVGRLDALTPQLPPPPPSPAASAPTPIGGNPGDAPSEGVVGQYILATDYWQGTFLHVPGQGGQEILKRAPGYSAAPTDGRSYPLVTQQNWQITCLPSVQNAAGEGFVAISPDGVSYRFDWMASRLRNGVVKTGAVASRIEMFLMATLVTDRFGNWVTYAYEPANPYVLKRIESSDGRTITLTNTGGGATLGASDGTRTISYGYSSTKPSLTSVQQSDGSRWTFEVPPISRTLFYSRRSPRCQPPSRPIRRRFVNRWSSWSAQVVASATWPESLVATPAASTRG
jgi:hypothetical protein